MHVIHRTGGIGRKPILYGATFPVSAMVMYVRPWKLLLNAITPGRPVWARAIFTASNCFRTGEERGFSLPAYRGKGVDFLRQGAGSFHTAQSDDAVWVNCCSCCSTAATY